MMNNSVIVHFADRQKHGMVRMEPNAEGGLNVWVQVGSPEEFGTAFNVTPENMQELSEACDRARRNAAMFSDPAQLAGQLSSLCGQFRDVIEDCGLISGKPTSDDERRYALRMTLVNGDELTAWTAGDLDHMWHRLLQAQNARHTQRAEGGRG